MPAAFRYGEQSLQAHREQEQIARAFDLHEQLAWALNNQAWVLTTTLARPQEALPLVHRALEIARQQALGPPAIESMEDTLRHAQGHRQP